MKKLVYLTLITLAWSCSSGTSESQSESAPGSTDVQPGVWFEEPADGATVTSPVSIKMGVAGMEIEPAGMVNEGKGHHHLIIDGSFMDAGVVIPADSTHIHYGQGQTEVQLELSPGTHTLTMQFADGVHTSYGEKWSKTISITVEESDPVTNQ